ncbi:hypothetical protein N2152v2_001797 [Parachlorella kessleri]
MKAFTAVPQTSKCPSVQEEEELTQWCLEDDPTAALCGLEHIQEVVQHLTPTVKAAAVAVGFLKLDGSSGSAPPPSHAAALCRRGCTKAGCCMGTAPIDGLALEPVLAKAKQAQYLSLRCLACSKELCTLRKGDQLSYDGQHAVIRRLRRSDRGHSWVLHVQWLSRQVEPCKGTQLELISSSSTSPEVLILTKRHQDISVEAFIEHWQQCRARVVPKDSRAAVLFSTAGPCHDLVGVPDAAPTYECCGCGCVNLWGKVHNACQGRDPSCSSKASEQAGTLKHGDWVWVVPQGDCLDKCMVLGRVLEPKAAPTPAEGERQPAEAKARVRVHTYQRRDCPAGFMYTPAGKADVPPGRLRTRLDPFTIPGVKVLRTDGSEELPPTCPEDLADTVDILELFSGYGGLGKGLEQSGVGETRWAVDKFPAALETLQRCHPAAATFCMDACDFLDAVKAGQEGFPTPRSPQQPGGRRRLIAGGPPCQGFSGANKNEGESRWKKNVLMLLCLAVVETLRPEFVVIENVAGLLCCDGMMECIVLALASLGYQVRWRLVNCGSYGVATHRRRVIILAAALGQPLPRFPEPTHVFNAGLSSSSSATEGGSGGGGAGSLKAARERRACANVPCHAALPALTVRDVIGDLPSTDAAGPVPYARDPVSFFAAHARGELREVTGHQLWKLEPISLLRCAAVPREGDAPPPGQAGWVGACAVTANPLAPARAADWRDLPGELQPACLRKGLEQDGRQYEGVFGRLLWGGQFSTVLTKPGLCRDTTTCTLHPEAHRPLTCRETARVQGIPDSVEFVGTIEERYLQIGNSVPVPLGAALGRAFKQALQLQAAREHTAPEGGG